MIVLLLHVACVIDGGLAAKDVEPVFDDGDTDPPDDDTAPAEECNGVDDDGDGVVDDGFPDEDGNGRADCLDPTCDPLVPGAAGVVSIDEACTGTPVVTDPWNVVVERQYTSSGLGVIVTPAVGHLDDDDGDGVRGAGDLPEIAFTTFLADTLVVLDGATGTARFERIGYDGMSAAAIADIDADGENEVVAVRTDYRVEALDADGNVEWTSSVIPGIMDTNISVADLDADGIPEVIADMAILTGTDGSTIALLGGLGASFRAPIAADLDQDGLQEVVIADRVFDHTGRSLWTNQAGGIAAVLDVDGDPGAEVIVNGGNEAWLYDSDGGFIVVFFMSGGRHEGAPCVADFDGDGDAEIAFATGRYAAMFEVDATLRWSGTMSDESGLAGCSAADLDGDGAYELLIADEGAFRIYDGASGAVLYENTNHASGTLMEYPVVADVDADGAAEIVLASGGGAWRGITILGHAGGGWSRVGSHWPFYDFAVTNTAEDGSVPSAPVPSWQAHNLYRARPPILDPATPDLRVAITDTCVADCFYGPVRLAFQVWNEGAVDVDAGVPVTVYAWDAEPRPVATVSLPAVPAGTVLEGIEVELLPEDLGTFGFVVQVDDDGRGAGILAERDEADNSDRIELPCP